VNALVVRIEPPLTISEQEVNTALERAEATLQEIRTQLNHPSFAAKL